jgi:ABC-type enterochelin transport system substrate-binding protein
MKRTLTATLLALALVACSNDSQTSSSSATPAEGAAIAQVKLTPEQLGTVGAEIKKSPDQAQQILARHNLTEESFEQAVRDVTENPDASKRYAEAYRKAGA